MTSDRAPASAEPPMLIKIISGALPPSAGRTFENPAAAKVLGARGRCNRDRAGAGRHRHPDPLGPNRGRAPLGRPAPDDRVLPLRALGRRPRAPRRVLRSTWRRPDPVRPRADRADQAPWRRDRGDLPQPPARLPGRRPDRRAAPRPGGGRAPDRRHQPRGDRRPGSPASSAITRARRSTNATATAALTLRRRPMATRIGSAVQVRPLTADEGWGLLSAWSRLPACVGGVPHGRSGYRETSALLIS